MKGFLKNNYKAAALILALLCIYLITRFIFTFKYVNILRETPFYNYIYVAVILVISAFMLFTLLCDLVTIYIRHGNVGSKSSHIGGDNK